MNHTFCAYVSVPRRFTTEKMNTWAGECVETFWDSNLVIKWPYDF